MARFASLRHDGGRMLVNPDHVNRVDVARAPLNLYPAKSPLHGKIVIEIGILYHAGGMERCIVSSEPHPNQEYMMSDAEKTVEKFLLDLSSSH